MKGKLSPVPVYLILTGGYAFFTTLVFSVNIVFQTQEAGLNPFQLVLVGSVLEATIFICEVPTGVVADLYGRRISVLCGLVLVGLGLMLSGVLAQFWLILLAQPVWGLGSTFLSGAQQAWIADEIGSTNAGPVYLRSAQIDQVCRLAAIPIGIAIGAYDLNLPILLGGAMLLGLAAFLVLAMPEQGFVRGASTAAGWHRLSGQMFSSARVVRGKPLLLTVFGIAAFYGMASEGFDRLWVAHFYHDLGFPTLWHLKPVIWFGVVRFGSALLSIVAVEVVRRSVDTNSHAGVARSLFLINALQAVSLFLFAAGDTFLVGMIAFWTAVALSRMYDPLYLAWINQNIDSSVRATVISMSSQSDSLGQIAGGPMLGAVGSLVALRAALFASGLALVPALALYLRAFALGKASPQDASEASET